jgi:hypothetical protein
VSGNRSRMIGVNRTRFSWKPGAVQEVFETKGAEADRPLWRLRLPMKDFDRPLCFLESRPIDAESEILPFGVFVASSQVSVISLFTS